MLRSRCCVSHNQGSMREDSTMIRIGAEEVKEIKTDEDSAELMAKLLSNPETVALLKALAKNL